ncbi:MAG: nucleoside recognition domain-containing protein [Candidatus Syntropharchaeia archaeon]
MTIKAFITEAIPFVLLGVFIVNVLYSSGIIEIIGNFTAPLVSGILGLPREAVGALIIGFLRKDVAVGMLLPLDFSLNQSVVASVVLTAYFPCVATFAILIKELGIRGTVISTCIMVFTAFSIGGLLNVLLGVVI